MANIWDTCSYNAEENSEVPFQGVALPRYIVIGCNHPISMVESNPNKTTNQIIVASTVFYFHCIKLYICISQYPNVAFCCFIDKGPISSMVFQPSAMFFSTSCSCNLRAIGGSRFERTKLVSHCFSSKVLTVASLAT